VINLRRDIHSLTEFKRRTAEFVKQVKATKAPLVLTVNGRAEVIVLDAESYQLLLDRAALTQVPMEDEKESSAGGRESLSALPF
jgi:prevent-host-death family protein